MINVGQLNDNIGELEKQINNIKSASRIFEELQKLSAEVKTDKELHDKLIKEALVVSKGMAETSGALINALDNLNQLSAETKKAIDKNLIEIKEESKSVNLSMTEAYKNYESVINSKYTSLNEDYLNKIAKLEENNDKNCIRICGSIATQLENNQRATSTEITNLNYGIQNSLMSFITSKTESMDLRFENKQKEDLANTKALKILVIISILVSGTSVILQFIK